MEGNHDQIHKAIDRLQEGQNKTGERLAILETQVGGIFDLLKETKQENKDDHNANKAILERLAKDIGVKLDDHDKRIESLEERPLRAKAGMVDWLAGSLLVGAGAAIAAWGKDLINYLTRH